MAKENSEKIAKTSSSTSPPDPKTFTSEELLGDETDNKMEVTEEPVKEILKDEQQVPENGGQRPMEDPGRLETFCDNLTRTMQLFMSGLDERLLTMKSEIELRMSMMESRFDGATMALSETLLERIQELDERIGCQETSKNDVREGATRKTFAEAAKEKAVPETKHESKAGTPSKVPEKKVTGKVPSPPKLHGNRSTPYLTSGRNPRSQSITVSGHGSGFPSHSGPVHKNRDFPNQRPVMRLSRQPSRVLDNRCRFCDGEHFTSSCGVYRTWASRLARLYELKTCTDCLKHHQDAHCGAGRPTCKECRQSHAFALCPTKFPDPPRE